MEYLRAQLAALSLEYAYQMNVCSKSDLMKARVTVQDAAAKAEAAKPKPSAVEAPKGQ